MCSGIAGKTLRSLWVLDWANLEGGQVVIDGMERHPIRSMSVVMSS